MSDLFNQTMTIQQVAGILEVGEDAIQHHVRNLYPGLMVNGKKTYLTQDQVTEIKQHMQPTKALVGAKTELEIIQGGFEYIQWMQSKIAELEQQKIENQPKVEFHDLVTAGDDCFGWKETVKILKLTLGRNKFLILLRAEKILMSDNTPYQQYIKDGYFKLAIKQVGHGGVEKVTLVTGKGLAWLQKRYDHVRLKEVV